MYEIKMNIQTIVKESTDEKIITPDQVYACCRDMSLLPQESVQLLTLTVKNKKLDRHMISLGTSTQSEFDVKAVFRAAILDNAASIIIVHNHPSGDPTPSASDIKITKRLAQAAEIMGIPLIDHVVIGRASKGASKPFYSLRDGGCFNVC